MRIRGVKPRAHLLIVESSAFLQHTALAGNTHGRFMSHIIHVSTHPFVPRFQPGTRNPKNEYGWAFSPTHIHFSAKLETGR
jgi:hypothetical protein